MTQTCCLLSKSVSFLHYPADSSDKTTTVAPHITSGGISLRVWPAAVKHDREYAHLLGNMTEYHFGSGLRLSNSPAPHAVFDLVLTSVTVVSNQVRGRRQRVTKLMMMLFIGTHSVTADSSVGPNGPNPLPQRFCSHRANQGANYG